MTHQILQRAYGYWCAYVFVNVWTAEAIDSLFPNRYALNPCSLQQGSNCGFESVLGINETYGSYMGLLMMFGETNCTVQLKECRKKSCYSSRDVTALLPSDPGIMYLTNGFFSSFQVVTGAKNVQLSRQGFAFEPTQKHVTVVYSTVSCQDFYRYHGRIPTQLCDKPIEAITQPDVDTPISLGCS